MTGDVHQLPLTYQTVQIKIGVWDALVINHNDI